MAWKVGCLVTPKKRVKNLKCGHFYEIIRVVPGLDGAYDFDEIYLKNKPGFFCEFNFKDKDGLDYGSYRT